MPEKILLTVTGLAHDGRGIGFIQPGHKAVFVTGALPGQTIECSITRHKKTFCEAELLSIIGSSLSEQPPHCPHADQCGGCPLQAMPYDEQLKWKSRLVQDALQRIGKLPGEKLEHAGHTILASPATRAYRNKIELAFGLNGHDLSLGFRKRSSHMVFNLQHCALVDKSAMPIIFQCRELASRSRIKRLLRFFTLRQDSGGYWHGILLTSPASASQRQDILALGRKLIECDANLVTLTHEERAQKDLLAKGERRIVTLDKTGEINSNAGCITLPLQNRYFKLDVASFFQVNTKAAEQLVDVAQQFNEQTSGPLLDVYCGVGAPGQLLADRHESCLGLELEKTATKYALLNAQPLPSWQYKPGDAAAMLRGLAHNKIGFETALLDPPRQGLAKDALSALMNIAPGHIIYISCNPSTLARDSNALNQKYELQKLMCVDMFPHTPHVECLTLWRKKIS